MERRFLVVVPHQGAGIVYPPMEWRATLRLMRAMAQRGFHDVFARTLSTGNVVEELTLDRMNAIYSDWE